MLWVVAVSKLLLPLLLLSTMHVLAAEDQFEVVQSFEIYQESDQYLYDNTKSVTAKILSSNGEFEGFVEFERFYSPLQSQQVSANKSIYGLHRKRTEYVESHDVFIDDTKVHLVEFKEVEQGDIYTVLYEYEETPIAWFPLIHAPRFENVSAWKVSVSHPENVQVVPHIVFAGDSIPYVLTFGEEELVIEFPSFRRVPDKPGLDEKQPIATLLFEIRNEKGLVNAVTPATLATWYYQQFPSDFAREVDSLQHKRVFRNSLSGVEQFDSAFSFVKKHVRYIADESGLNAIVPRSPQSVIERGWGDCKDKAYLVQALCDTETTQVHPVLVHTKMHNNFAGHTHVWLYNHVIAVFIDGTDTVYADPTNPFGDIGTLGSSLYGSRALILDRENPKLVQLPELPAELGLSVRIAVDKENLSACRAELDFRGYHAMRFLTMQNSTRSNRLPEALNGMLGTYFRKLKVEEIDSIEMRNKHIRVVATIDLSGLLIQGARSSYVPAMPFNFLSPALLERTNDNLALMLNGVRNVQLTLDLPGSVELGDVEAYNMSSATHGFAFEVVTSAANSSTLRFATRRGLETLHNDEKTSYLSSVEKLIENRNQLIKITW